MKLTFAEAAATILLMVAGPSAACEPFGLPQRPPLLHFKPGSTSPENSRAVAQRVRDLAPFAKEYPGTLGAVIVEWIDSPEPSRKVINSRRADFIVGEFVHARVPAFGIILRPLPPSSNLAAFSESVGNIADSLQVRSAECGDGTFV